MSGSPRRRRHRRRGIIPDSPQSSAVRHVAEEVALAKVTIDCERKVTAANAPAGGLIVTMMLQKWLAIPLVKSQPFD